MKAKVVRDMSRREIAIEVTGAPHLDVTESWQTRTRKIEPDKAVVVLIDGEFHTITVKGYQVNKSGAISPSQRGEWVYRQGRGYNRSELLESAPDWVQEVARESPREVISWNWPEQL
jgi:hypothetical protein